MATVHRRARDSDRLGERRNGHIRFPRMLTLLAWESELRRGPYAVDRARSESARGAISP